MREKLKKYKSEYLIYKYRLIILGETKVQDILKGKSKCGVQDDRTVQIIENSDAYDYRVKTLMFYANP